MPISVTSKIYTYANGSANDGSQVDTEFAALYNNDTTLANTLNTQAAQISALQAFQIPTATVLPLMSSILPTGWLYLDGRTIGNASSGGVARANLDVQNLYTILWNGTNDTQCPVSSGRGLNATADFLANKTITLPDARGRLLLGLDNLGGGSLANRVTSASLGGANSTVLAGSGGEQVHTQTIAEMPSHSHNVANIAIASGSGNIPPSGSIGTGSPNTSNTGGGAPFNVMNPWLALNFIIKL